MSTALQTRHAGLVNMDLWNVMRDQAAVLVKSGLLPSTVNTPEKAVAIMLKGSELGIPPMYALSNIVVIQGKPTANAELMLALIYRDHGDGAIQFVRSDNQVCTVSYSRRTWTERQTFSFSLDDAKQAGLLSNATWQKYPAAMLRARAISAVARMAFPDSIGGMYTPEELGAAVAVNGDTGEIVIDAQEVPAESTPGRAVGAGERRAPSAPTPSTPTDPLPTGVVINPGVMLAGRAFRAAAETAGFATKEAQDAFAREQYPGRRLASLTEDEWRALELKCRAMYSDVPSEEPIFS